MPIGSPADGSNSETDSDPTIYFVPETLSQNKKKRRKKPHVVIPQTPLYQPSSSSESASGTDSEVNSMKKTRYFEEDYSDSERNPPLIRLSQANIMSTDIDTGSQEEDNDIPLPFVRSSHASIEETLGMSNDGRCDSSDTNSVKIPSAQPDKYDCENIQDNSTPDSNTCSTSDVTTDASGQFKIPFCPSPSPSPILQQPDNFQPEFGTVSDDLSQDGLKTSTPKESVDGTYSLVAKSMKLSTL